MAFTKLTTDVENIQKLADRPQLSAQQLKAAFDGAGADIKQYLTETLVPEMEAVTAAESIGADGILATATRTRKTAAMCRPS